jgi:hypothetical protein
MEHITNFFRENYFVIIPMLTIISIGISYMAAKKSIDHQKAQEKKKLENEILELKMQVTKDKSELRVLQNSLNKIENSSTYNFSNSNSKKDNPIIQLEKIMYVKFLYLVPDSHEPIYNKYVARIDKSIPVRTESIHYRFNKFNQPIDCNITDSTNFGVVDMTVIYPWRRKLIGPRSRTINSEKTISQELSDSDTYISSSTYLNGFEKGEERYSIRAEYPTKCARLILDFSSIPSLDKLFLKEPLGYRFFDENKKQEGIINNCIHKINKGTYALIVNDLEKFEIIQLEFFINWKYVDDLDN